MVALAMSATSTALSEGSRLDHYRIVSILGVGAFSEAYEAVDERTGQTVVIKLPNVALIGDPQIFERFQREMTITRRLDHPNIQRAVDEGRDTDHSVPYLVLEYVDGQSLRQYLTGRMPLPTDEALRLADQIAAALAFAHSHGVAHRDVKPENVLVDADGHAKLADFGIALLSGARRVTWRWLNDGVGTPDYMAPEQIQGKRGDERTDVYALGTMLYEMLSGRVPFSGDNPLAVMNQAVHSAPPPLRSLRRSVPPALEAVVHKALRKNPAERYPDAAAMLFDLEHLDAVNLSEFVSTPEVFGRGHQDISFRNAVLFGSLIAVAFILVIVGSVLITILVQRH
jgi:serine/threonine-protein kinase